MRLTVLGSGTVVPHPARSSPAFWLETRSGTMLLDCGPSVLLRMAQEKLDWPNLGAIWISHFHLDHVGGLAPLLFGTRNAPEMQKRTHPLTIYGPKGIRELIEKFDAANNYKLFRQPFPLNIHEVEPLAKFKMVDSVEAIALSTPHTDHSLALHLRHSAGKSFVYTSDMGFGETVAAFAQNSDLLVMECSFFRQKAVEIHLELAEAMHLIRKAKPKRVLLTHFYSEWDGVRFDEEVNAFAPGCEVFQAADGMRVDI